MSHIQPQAGPSTSDSLNHTHNSHNTHAYYQQQPQQHQRIQPQPQLEYPQPSSQNPQSDASDWNRSLKRLAKTAELKKHSLTLQMHTAHVLSAHEALQVRSSTIEDIRAQKNWLESERTNLVNQLQQVNEDRQKADALEARMQHERVEFQNKIRSITEGEYATLKQQVDGLRAELGLTPVRSLQSLLDEKSAAYLQKRRLEQQPQQPQLANASKTQPSTSTSAAAPQASSQTVSSSPPSAPKKKGRPPKHPRPSDGEEPSKVATATGTTVVSSTKAAASSNVGGTSATGATGDNPPPRKRGRPKGSKNNPALKEARAAKAAAAAAAASGNDTAAGT